MQQDQVEVNFEESKKLQRIHSPLFGSLSILPDVRLTGIPLSLYFALFARPRHSLPTRRLLHACWHCITTTMPTRSPPSSPYNISSRAFDKRFGLPWWGSPNVLSNVSTSLASIAFPTCASGQVNTGARCQVLRPAPPHTCVSRFRTPFRASAAGIRCCCIVIAGGVVVTGVLTKPANQHKRLQCGNRQHRFAQRRIRPPLRDAPYSRPPP